MDLRKLFASVALTAALAAGGAQASTLFSDNFNGENGGNTYLNYGTAGGTFFANFTVTGQVDLVKSGDYSINCGAGACVDLDGSGGPGAMTSSSIAYSGGQLLTIEFDVSGNQRDRNDDVFNFTANFGQSTDILNFAILQGFTYGAAGNYFGVTTLGLYGETINGGAAFKHYALSFTPTANGTLQLYFGTTSGDNIGPILDNVLVSGGAVPEPATWALMIAGFGLAGAALRRRQVIAA